MIREENQNLDEYEKKNSKTNILSIFKSEKNLKSLDK